MNLVSILIGFLMCAFGIATIYIRKNSPEKFKKLAPMKKMYGEKAGFAIHFFGYSIVPFVLGAFVIIQGYSGKNIFEIL